MAHSSRRKNRHANICGPENRPMARAKIAGMRNVCGPNAYFLGRSDHLFLFMKFEVKMVCLVSSVSEFSKLKDEIQSILDGECDAGNLAQMHNKVALLSAQNTLNTGGQDEDLTAIVNFIGHAAYVWKLFPSSDWKIQLHAALMVLEKHFDEEVKIMERRLNQSARDMSQIQGWQKIEDDVLEEQMTRFLQDHYQREGYSVDLVQVRKIYTREGQVCAELDGLLIADSQEKESMLLTVEAKHVLREDDVTDRRKKLGKFIDFLANIPDEDDKNARMKFRILCNQLRLCRGLRLEHYIGAGYVPESVKILAQKNGFNVLQYRGDRYDFVPLKEV